MAFNNYTIRVKMTHKLDYDEKHNERDFTKYLESLCREYSPEDVISLSIKIFARHILDFHLFHLSSEYIQSRYALIRYYLNFVKRLINEKQLGYTVVLSFFNYYLVMLVNIYTQWGRNDFIKCFLHCRQKGGLKKYYKINHLIPSFILGNFSEVKDYKYWANINKQLCKNNGIMSRLVNNNINKLEYNSNLNELTLNNKCNNNIIAKKAVQDILKCVIYDEIKVMDTNINNTLMIERIFNSMNKSYPKFLYQFIPSEYFFKDRMGNGKDLHNRLIIFLQHQGIHISNNYNRMEPN